MLDPIEIKLKLAALCTLQHFTIYSGTMQKFLLDRKSSPVVLSYTKRSWAVDFAWQ